MTWLYDAWNETVAWATRNRRYLFMFPAGFSAMSVVTMALSKTWWAAPFAVAGAVAWWQLAAEARRKG